MSKTLKVIEPFFSLEVGDILELSEDGKDYVIEQNESFGSNNAEGADVRSSFTSKFTISVDYAKALVKEGMLAEETTKSNFVNIFEEIDKLLVKYTSELSTIDADFKDKPACLKIEKNTVLTNLITLLNHLKGLKK